MMLSFGEGSVRTGREDIKGKEDSCSLHCPSVSG
jgi:hypothetical protein